jgi:hypothetical protein
MVARSPWANAVQASRNKQTPSDSDSDLIKGFLGTNATAERMDFPPEQCSVAATATCR